MISYTYKRGLIKKTFNITKNIQSYIKSLAIHYWSIKPGNHRPVVDFIAYKLLPFNYGYHIILYELLSIKCIYVYLSL